MSSVIRGSDEFDSATRVGPQLMTAIATTSGTAHDFTGIPSWVKRITVMLSIVSTNGTSIPIIQIGASGGIETSGYAGATSTTSTVAATSNHSTGILLEYAHAAATVISGNVILTKQSGNTWTVSGTLARSNEAAAHIIGGAKSLTDTLTQIRLTTVNGTDTFDAGSVNIMYE